MVMNMGKDSAETGNVDYFANFADVWWSEMTPLHKMNHIRIPFILEGLMSTGKVTDCSFSDVHILDVGCGGGILSEALAREGLKVTGLEPADDLIQVAKSHAERDPGLGIDYIASFVEDHASICPEKYDALVASEVVEHVDDPKTFLTACTKVLKPGGSIFITTINRTFWAWLIFVLLFEYILRVIPLGSHLYKKFISPEEVEDILHSNGCVTKKLKGEVYVPFIEKWFWVPSTCVGYALHAVKDPKKNK